MPSKRIKNLIFIVFSILLLTGSVVFYFNYQLNLAKKDYDAKISNLSLQTSKQLDSLQTGLENIILNLSLNLSSQIISVDASLDSFKLQNEKQIITLSSLIDQIERQSNIKLNELKQELKDVQINSADFSAIVNDVLQSVVSVRTNLGQGSGAIIDAKGYIVTNVHVISGALSIKVNTYSGKTYDASQIIGYDANADVAVLKIDASGLKSLKYGDSSALKVGEKVIAAGNPAGLAFTVTEGIVSAFRTADNGIKYIQTDVPINPGNSGGPLINTKGEIVGINNFKISGGFEGLGFAIASNEVKKVTDKIISDYELSLNK